MREPQSKKAVNKRDVYVCRGIRRQHSKIFKVIISELRLSFIFSFILFLTFLNFPQLI